MKKRNEALSELFARYSNGVDHIRCKHQDGIGRGKDDAELCV